MYLALGQKIFLPSQHFLFLSISRKPCIVERNGAYFWTRRTRLTCLRGTLHELGPRPKFFCRVSIFDFQLYLGNGASESCTRQTCLRCTLISYIGFPILLPLDFQKPRKVKGHSPIIKLVPLITEMPPRPLGLDV